MSYDKKDNWVVHYPSMEGECMHASEKLSSPADCREKIQELQRAYLAFGRPEVPNEHFDISYRGEKPSWREVYNSDLTHCAFWDVASKKAEEAGYPYYLWNGIVYQVGDFNCRICFADDL